MMSRVPNWAGKKLSQARMVGGDVLPNRFPQPRELGRAISAVQLMLGFGLTSSRRQNHVDANQKAGWSGG
jgi:hypothetical protein